MNRETEQIQAAGAAAGKPPEARDDRRKGRKHPIMKTILILVILAAAAFGGILAYLCIQEGKVQRAAAGLPKDYDAVIVLGAQVRPDGTPSVQLAWRLDAAAEAWREKQVPVVVCGAQGKDEPETEAAAMKRYLTEKGIPEDMIRMDPASFNTEQNLRNAAALLQEMPGEIRKVIVVTSDYHVPRAMALARDQGLEAEGLGAPCLPEYWIKNHGREVLAWCKYWIKKIIH